MPNYPTHLGFLHIYLDGEDATRQIPSGYLLAILDSLLVGTSGIITRRLTSSIAQWFSDPWQLEIEANGATERVAVTLQVPGRWVAMDAVRIPLAEFAGQVVSTAQRWARYLESQYHHELWDHHKGKEYQRFLVHLAAAESSLEAS